jgi:hypothetical protein
MEERRQERKRGDLQKSKLQVGQGSGKVIDILIEDQAKFHSLEGWWKMFYRSVHSN